MPDQLAIRCLTIDDLPQCEENFPPPVFISYRRQILRQSKLGYSLYGYFVNDQLAGLIHVNRQGAKDRLIRQSFPYPMLGNLVVSFKYRQRGIAKKLLRHSEDTLRSEGYAAAGLIVSVDNRPAISLYEKANYLPLERLPPRAGYDKHPRTYLQKVL